MKQIYLCTLCGSNAKETRNKDPKIKPNTNQTKTLFEPALYHDQNQYPCTFLHLRIELNDERKNYLASKYFVGFSCVRFCR